MVTCLAQADQIYANLKTVPASQGAGFEHLVKTTTFAKAGIDLAPLRSRARYAPDQIPAASFVMVGSLMDPEWLLEMEAIAVVPAAHHAPPACDGAPYFGGRGGMRKALRTKGFRFTASSVTASRQRT